jgi:hypothetical protein
MQGPSLEGQGPTKCLQIQRASVVFLVQSVLAHTTCTAGHSEERTNHTKGNTHINIVFFSPSNSYPAQVEGWSKSIATAKSRANDLMGLNYKPHHLSHHLSSLWSFWTSPSNFLVFLEHYQWDFAYHGPCRQFNTNL